jgi:hypothetical protein
MAASITKVTDKAPLPGLGYIQVFTVSFASVTSGVFAYADHGFQNIVEAIYTPDVSDDHGITKVNSNGSTTVQGSVSVSAVTSNDTGRLTIIGN